MTVSKNIDTNFFLQVHLFDAELFPNLFNLFVLPRTNECKIIIHVINFKEQNYFETIIPITFKEAPWRLPFHFREIYEKCME